MKHVLSVTLPENPTPVEYPLEAEVTTLGRAASNDITLRVDEVSTNHLEFRKTDDDKLLLVDLDSTNGTKVNGAQVTEHELSPGDQLLIGETVRAEVTLVTEEEAVAVAKAIPVEPVAPTIKMSNPAPSAPTVMLQKRPPKPSPAPVAATPAPVVVAKPVVAVEPEPDEDEPAPIKPRKLIPPGTVPPPTAAEAPPKPAINGKPKPKLVVQNADGPKRPKLNLG